MDVTIQNLKTRCRGNPGYEKLTGIKLGEMSPGVDLTTIWSKMTT